MAIIPKIIYRFHEMPIKIPVKIFTGLERTILNSIWGILIWITNAILYNKEASGGITVPDFKLYYRATVLKTAWYWDKNRQKNQ